jgi:chlorobactene glucosyltransferase
VEWTLACLYLLLGPGAWGVFWFAMIKGRARMMIRPKPMPVIDPPPLVTVIVPCKDEEAHIATCVASILNQDWPNFELIVVNDRSTDRTAEILDDLARRDPRLRVVHVSELPEGWFGKIHGMHVGAQHAKGEWLLYVDSDCVLAPSAVRVGITTGVAREFDLVSFVARFEGRGFWDSLMTPLGGIVTGAMYQLMFANSTHVPKVAFACGQYMAVRRQVYDDVGGWAAVKHLIADDVEMARLLKGKGKRPRLGWGMDLVMTHMYDSFAKVWRGWGRQFIVASRGKPGRVLGGVLFVVVGVLSVYPAIAWGVYRQLHPVNALGGIGWLATAALHILLMTTGLASAYKWGGNSPARALLWPLSSLVLLAIFARSLYLSITRKIDWRGGSYALQPATAQASTATPASVGKSAS